MNVIDSREWVEWKEGEKIYFKDLANAYVEWQRTVRSPVAPMPTPKGALGKLFGRVGLTECRDSSGRRMRVLPETATCLENVWKKDEPKGK